MNFFKRKDKAPAPAEAPKKAKKKRGSTLSTATEQFQEKYMKNDIWVPLAVADETIGIASEPDGSLRTNDVLIINDTHKKMIDNIVLPMIAKGNMSYVIYDPTGEIYGRAEEILRQNHYDVRVVDFCDTSINSTDRIDFFEMVNIHHRTEELAKIMSNCLDTELNQKIAFAMLVMAFEYIIELGVEISPTRLRWVFNQIKENNREIINSINSCKKAGNALRYNIEGMTRGNILKVIDRLDTDVIPAIEKFGVNPTIYSVLTMKRNVAIFIKSVANENNYIATTMIYNLMSLSSISGDDQQLNTVVFDIGTDEWYNRAEIKRWRRNSKTVNGEATSIVYVREKMSDVLMNDFIPALTVYVSCTDTPTVDWAYETIKKQYIVANNLEDKEGLDIGLTKIDLEIMEDCVLFASSGNPDLQFAPMRCKLLHN